MAEKTTEVMQVLVVRGRDGEEAEPFAFRDRRSQSQW
jgi:hypothetical protein